MDGQTYSEVETRGFIAAYGTFRRTLSQVTGRADELRLYEGDLVLNRHDHSLLLGAIDVLGTIPRDFRNSTSLPDPEELRKDVKKIKIKN